MSKKKNKTKQQNINEIFLSPPQTPEIGSHYTAQLSLELLGSSKFPCFTSQVTEPNNHSDSLMKFIFAVFPFGDFCLPNGIRTFGGGSEAGQTERGSYGDMEKKRSHSLKRQCEAG